MDVWRLYQHYQHKEVGIIIIISRRQSSMSSNLELKNFIVKIKSLTSMKVVTAHTMVVKEYGTMFMNLEGLDRCVYYAPNINTEYCMEEDAAEEIHRRR